MPEFILNKPNPHKKPPHPFYALDEFAQGYVEAMFFTNCDSGDPRENLANELGVERLTRASVKAIERDCRAFLSHNMPDGCFVRQWLNRLIDADPRPRYGDGVSDDRRAGHFFWYARQGHGVAWSDDYCSEDSGNVWAEGLQDECRKWGESYPEIWRGWIHYR